MHASRIICHLSLKTSIYILRRHHVFRHLPKFARKADNNHQNIEETMKQNEGRSLTLHVFMSKDLLKGISEIVANVKGIRLNINSFAFAVK